MADAPVPPRLPLRPFLVPDLAVPVEAERRMAALARAAQAGDREAREALWEELAPAIDRVAGAAARRVRAGGTGGPLRDGKPWDAEDLGQEAFPIVVDLLAAWDGERPIVPYLLGYLPWRLRSVWRAMLARRRAETESASATLRRRYLADESAAAQEALALLDAFAADLPPIDRAILLRHVRDGEPLGTVARGLGLDRRTVGRRWAAIKADLRRED